jgi:hypothetical protein
MQIVLLHRLPAGAILASIMVSCLPTAGSAVEEFSINGSVYIAGRHPVDPPANEAKNTHAYLTLKGQGAVRMYRAMTASAEDDLCRGDGWKIKRAGHLACSTSSDGKKAECDFSVELRRGTLDPGSPC